MLRDLLSSGYNTVRDFVRLMFWWATLASFLALRPAAELRVSADGACFFPGRCATAFAPHLGGKFGAARNPFVTAIRASHARNLFA